MTSRSTGTDVQDRVVLDRVASEGRASRWTCDGAESRTDPVVSAPWQRLQLQVAVDAARLALAPTEARVTAQLEARERRLIAAGWSRIDREVRLRVRLSDGRTASEAHGLISGDAQPDPDRAAAVGREAARRWHALPAPAGKAPLLLAPAAAGRLLHELIGHPAEADWPGARPAIPELLRDLVDDSGQPDDLGVVHAPIEIGRGARILRLRQQDGRYDALPRMEHLRLAGPGGKHAERFDGYRIEQMSAAAIDADGRVRLNLLGTRDGSLYRLSVQANAAELLQAVEAVEGDAETHAGRCLKAGQVVTVWHTVPAIRLGAMPLDPPSGGLSNGEDLE